MMMARIMLGLSLLATPMLAAYTSASLELEHFSRGPKFAPLVVIERPDASAGKAIVLVLPEGESALTVPDTVTDRQLEVAFTTTKLSVVNVYIRGFFPDRGQDSIFLKLDDDRFFTLNDITSPTWDVYGRGFPLVEAGEHTLVIMGREQGAVMDKLDIKVTEGEVFSAGPGLTVELESLSSQSSFSPFVIGSHPNATGEYIVLPDSTTPQSDPLQGTDRQMEIAFTVSETTDIDLEVRVSFPADTSASFFYKLDDESFQTLSHISTEGEWVSLFVRNYAAVLAGGHTLVIKAWETGAKLDSITLLTSTGVVALERGETPQPPPTPLPIASAPEEKPSLPSLVPQEEHASQHGMSPICVLGLTVLCAVLF